MTQLVKGGKNVYGWSIVTDEGYIKISREVLEEYDYKPNNMLILMPGSRGSEGFSVSTLEKLRSSPLVDRLNSLLSALKETREGETVTFDGKAF